MDPPSGPTGRHMDWLTDLPMIDWLDNIPTEQIINQPSTVWPTERIIVWPTYGPKDWPIDQWNNSLKQGLTDRPLDLPAEQRIDRLDDGLTDRTTDPPTVWIRRTQIMSPNKYARNFGLWILNFECFCWNVLLRVIHDHAKESLKCTERGLWLVQSGFFDLYVMGSLFSTAWGLWLEQYEVSDLFNIWSLINTKSGLWWVHYERGFGCVCKLRGLNLRWTEQHTRFRV